MEEYLSENSIFRDYLNFNLTILNEYIYLRRHYLKDLYGIEIEKSLIGECIFKNDLSIDLDEKFEEFQNRFIDFEFESRDEDFLKEVKRFLFTLSTDTSQKIFFNDIIKQCYSSLTEYGYYIGEYSEIKLNVLQKNFTQLLYQGLRLSLLLIIRDYYNLFKDIIDSFLEKNKLHNIFLLNTELNTSNQFGSTNTNYYWFKVGLALADGRIYDLIDRNNSCNEIAKILFDNTNTRPYISESLSTSTKSDKNIFNNIEKVEKILKYCEVKEIIVHPRFTNNYQILKTRLN